jgi:hypothetical protein
MGESNTQNRSHRISEIRRTNIVEGEGWRHQAKGEQQAEQGKTRVLSCDQGQELQYHHDHQH